MQSRRLSALESVVNIIVGIGISLALQLAFFWRWGLEVSIDQNLSMTAAFTVASFFRSYYIRRGFNHWRSKQ